MSKLKKDFEGVPDGAIYPVKYKVGEECPPELLAGARELGALDDDGKIPGNQTVAELKAALDAKQVSYPANAKKEDLLALLNSGEGY